MQGPQARARLATIAPEAAAIGRFRVGEATVAGVPCTVAGPATPARTASSSPCPPIGPRPCGTPSWPAAWCPPAWGHATRCASRPALPLHGHELGPGITSLQAGLGWVVAWDKPGGFRGRDALLAEKERGVARRLRGLATEGRRPPRADQTVLVDGEEVGVVTSGNFSPMLEHGIALGFVPPSVAEGDLVTIAGKGDPTPATVVPLPFVAKR